MKRVLLGVLTAAILAGILGTLSGCIFVDDHDHGPRHHRVHRPHAPHHRHHHGCGC